MKKIPAFAALLLLWFTSACAQAPRGDFSPAQLKDFPRSQLTIERAGGRDSFRIWIADTPARQSQGLMWLRELPADHGMLFVLDAIRPMNMWMKNTYVSLDMVFFDAEGRILKIAADTEPLSTAIISSGLDVAGVLEIRAGETRRRGIVKGDRLLHPLLGK